MQDNCKIKQESSRLGGAMTTSTRDLRKKERNVGTKNLLQESINNQRLDLSTQEIQVKLNPTILAPGLGQ